MAQRRVKLPFTAAQVRPGFGKSVGYAQARQLGYEPHRWTQAQRFEAFQRVAYLELMGRWPELGTDTTTLDDVRVDVVTTDPRRSA